MRNVFRWLAVVVAVLAVALLAGCGNEVPDVVGMRQDEAVRTLQDAGFKLGDLSFVATREVPLGMIAAQSPAAGERARSDTAVSLAIASTDGSRVLVPTVTGMSQVTAEGVARTLGLTPLVVEQHVADVASGEVAGQVPAPGSEVDTASTLVLVVSTGAPPEKATVPDVTGDAESDAVRVLNEAGFETDVIGVFSSDVAGGKVIAQVPEGDDSALAGSTVQVVVSQGPGAGTVKMPSVTGKKESDATSAIDKAGLRVRTVKQYDAAAKGTVSQQFPSAGAAVVEDSEVLIVVSLGTEPADTVTVPDVAGKTPDEATSILEGAGLGTDVEEAAHETADGVVFFQFPSAGGQATPGTEVLIVVGVVDEP